MFDELDLSLFDKIFGIIIVGLSIIFVLWVIICMIGGN